jgi:hypothetical protein
MKTKNHYLILAVVMGILSIPALGRTESLLPENRLLLIGRPHPALAGIDTLHVVYLRPGTEPSKDGLVWKELQAKVITNLNMAGVKLSPGIAGSTLNIQELRIYINMLKLEDSQQYVFRIQISLARAVHLTKEKNLVFKADVWKTNPVMQAVSIKNMPAKVTDVVLERVEVFIQAYKASNPPGGQLSDAKESQADSPTVSETQAESAETEYEYVASKSSNVFHKPSCRWAKNIKPGNLVVYNNKDEATKADKRPCKSCKP